MESSITNIIEQDAKEDKVDALFRALLVWWA